MTTHLILASSSPRRRQLLTDARYRFEVVPPRPEAEDEGPTPADAEALVQLLAWRKAADVVQQGAQRPGAWVLAADTVAECAGEVLGKPADQDDARRILQTLSGTQHRVLTGVCLWQLGAAEPAASEVVCSTLAMQPLSPDWLDAYLASGAWRGKAGAFGYQDDLGVVSILDGAESNVVGLPMPQVQAMLAKFAGIHPVT